MTKAGKLVAFIVLVTLIILVEMMKKEGQERQQLTNFKRAEQMKGGE